MSEMEKTIAAKLDRVVAKMNDRGRERLLDIGNGYLMGYNDGVGTEKATHAELQQPATVEAAQ